MNKREKEEEKGLKTGSAERCGRYQMMGNLI